MAARPRRRFWWWARLGFRWCRIAVLLVGLAGLLGAIWLNRVGLPQFLKDRLVAELHQRGFDLSFSRMRLHWYRGLVAENVRFVRATDTNAPQVSATEAELLLDGRALRQREVRLKGLGVRGGRMVLPVWGTNSTPSELVVDRISGELRFSPPDEWELVGFHARTFGVNVLLGGTVTNASALSKTKISRSRRPQERSAAAFWHDLISKLEQSQFDQPTEVIGKVTGDALVPASFRASISISSPRASSPWGSGTNVTVWTQIAPSSSGVFQADVRIHARDAVTRWGQAGSFGLEGRVAPSFTRWTPTNAHLALAMKQVRTTWAKAAVVNLVADFTPSPSDDTASLAHYTLKAQQVETRWAKAARLELTSDSVLTSSNLWPSSATARLQFSGGAIEGGRASSGTLEASLRLPPLASLELTNNAFTWWRRADTIGGGVQIQLSDVHTPRLEIADLAFEADWHSPSLRLREVHATLYDGTVDGRAELDTSTRRLMATAATSVDPKKVQSLLDTNSQKWLAQFTWERAPLLKASGEVVLPEWTNAPPAFATADWDKEVLPTLRLNGDLQIERGSYRGVDVTSAQSAFGFSNLTWFLPNLVVTRPEGRALIVHRGHSRTHEFMFDIDSTANPLALRPLLGKIEREVLDSFVFTNMPHVRIQMTGSYHEPEKTSLYATMAVTNVNYRNLPVREARSVITLTNQVLSFLQPVVVRAEGTGRADAVRVDPHQKLVIIENATGSLDPWAVTHAVGPETEEAMRPYRFGAAPQARVHGVIGIDSTDRSDIHFELAGGPFDWSFLHFQQITGHVHWFSNAVTLSNIVGSVNGGKLEAGVRLEFPNKEPCQFSFRTAVNDINLHALVADLGNSTNKVQGALYGILTVTRANTEDPKSWQGSGNLAVNDGLLWDFPVVGLFSPLLNSIKPGLGNSRAKEAVATFIITNSVIHSDDLTVHASGMRLKFNGSVDFDTRINGNMTAQLLRDMPGFGILFSTVMSPFMKLLEYKVTGTLAHPAAYPRYLPNPFHPFRSSREPGEEKPPK